MKIICPSCEAHVNDNVSATYCCPSNLINEYAGPAQPGTSCPSYTSSTDYWQDSTPLVQVLEKQIKILQKQLDDARSTIVDFALQNNELRTQLKD